MVKNAMHKSTVTRILFILGLFILSTILVPHRQVAYGATLTVNSLGDGADASPGNGVCATSGSVCTLRAAIQEANALGGADNINFSVTGTITPASALPTVTGTTNIDAGFNAQGNIVLNGSSAGNVNGLVFAATATSSFLQGFNIRNFQQNGLVIQASTMVVYDCFIGTNQNGTTDQGNTGNGIYITGNGNAIGGANSSLRNTISGNQGSGIVIEGGSGNFVRANFIGLNYSGTSAIGNSTYGVLVLNGTGNVIGGSTVEGNFISGNTGSGVVFSGGSGNQVRGNFIGITNNQQAAGNGGNGVEVVNSPSSAIGNGEGYGNLISRNGANGISVDTSDNTIVQSNTVGADVTNGTVAWPNGQNGLVIRSSNSVVVGGISGQDNEISGNAGYGIYVVGGTSVQLLNNEVGTNGPSTVAVGNGQAGVRLENGTGFLIETLTSSANGGNGIEIVGGGSHTFRRNFIGVGNGGTQALPNNGDGFSLQNTTNNAIGGPNPGEGNTISGNTGSGVSITGGSANVVQQSVIGLRLDLAAALPNGGHGVLIVNSNGNLIGQSYTQFNWIAGNAGGGVMVLSGTGNIIRSQIWSNGGMAIDLDASGTVPFDGPSLNDPLDPDGGTNALTNYVTLTTANSNSVNGVMRGLPNTSYTIALFNSDACDPTGFGEGQRYFNSVTVMTDASGNATYGTGAPPVGASTVYTAVATGPTGTSEFSPCLRAYTTATDTLALLNPSNRNASLVNTLADLPPGSSYLTYATGAPAAAANGQFVMGDWDGNGQKTPGIYGTNGVFYWKNQLGAGGTWQSLWIGLLNRPAVAGRFNAALTNDCIGAIDSANFPPFGTAFAMYFTCSLTNGAAPALTFQWLSVLLPDNQGFSGTHQFVAGDYDGDQVETIACRRGPYIAYSNTPPTTQNSLFPNAQYIGAPTTGNSNVVAGDWNGDLIDSFGLFYENGSFYYRNDLQFNSGVYTLQRLGQPVGAPVVGHAWRAVANGSGGPAGGEPGGATTGAVTPNPATPAPTVVTQVIESDDARVARDGAWTRQSAGQASGGAYLFADNKDATLTLEFTGTSAEVIYLAGPQMGSFTIVIDDVAVRTVIAHADQVAFNQRSVINYLSDGPHTLQIVAVDGTSSIDAFVVGQGE